jgi:hypothetical protein
MVTKKNISLLQYPYSYTYKAIMEWIQMSQPQYVWLGDVWRKSNYDALIATESGWKYPQTDLTIPYENNVKVFK